MGLNHQESRFFDFLLEINRPYMKNFEKWVFQPGMLFNSLDKWWGDKKKRETAHEGIDLCCFKEADGRINHLHRGIKIPATFAGNIVKTEKDFLGTSIYLSHDIFSPDQRRLFTIYGHTTPLNAVAAKQKVEAGEPIAEVSEFAPEGTDILPHLHISFAWVPVSLNPGLLNWQNLAENPEITLIDPFSVLSPPSGMAEPT
jgi:hypothetical protein